MSNTPTDAEIDEVTLDVLGYAALDKETNDTARMIARAVLAKWAAPQPAPAPLSDDSALLDWIAIHGSFGVDSSTGKVGGNGQKCVAATRKNIRAALAAQGGKA